MIRFMLDTNVCIDIMRGRSPTVLQRLHSVDMDNVGVSSITLCELSYGAVKSARRSYNGSLLITFCTPISIISFDAHAAEVYGVVCAALEALGRPIGPLDLLIAAHALSIEATLITANVNAFRRVEGLTVDNWKS